MFTGIIEEVGKVSSIRTEDASIRLQIQTKEILKDIHIGDSIAVNGICLTVTKYDTDSFCADVMHETMNRTSLKLLRRGSKVVRMSFNKNTISTHGNSGLSNRFN